eukprot:TRINITY_DN7028_c0_g1_i3.p1 TRINITY_DN7028_c0_g1~~TRINITY_DN7028_c0_g1_i3.p1  ORF type:complete len:211 (+),score=47.23 TRINITY_DN7028_c0_g1_i3:96-728(+)
MCIRDRYMMGSTWASSQGGPGFSQSARGPSPPHMGMIKPPDLVSTPSFYDDLYGGKGGSAGHSADISFISPGGSGPHFGGMMGGPPGMGGAGGFGGMGGGNGGMYQGQGFPMGGSFMLTPEMKQMMLMRGWAMGGPHAMDMMEGYMGAGTHGRMSVPKNPEMQRMFMAAENAAAAANLQRMGNGSGGDFGASGSAPSRKADDSQIDQRGG